MGTGRAAHPSTELPGGIEDTLARAAQPLISQPWPGMQHVIGGLDVRTL